MKQGYVIVLYSTHLRVDTQNNARNLIVISYKKINSIFIMVNSFYRDGTLNKSQGKFNVTVSNSIKRHSITDDPISLSMSLSVFRLYIFSDDINKFSVALDYN